MPSLAGLRLQLRHVSLWRETQLAALGLMRIDLSVGGHGCSRAALALPVVVHEVQLSIISHIHEVLSGVLRAGHGPPDAVAIAHATDKQIFGGSITKRDRPR
jgi:hypothetical protein